MKNTYKANPAGFTLIEISIVLVIIALIMGGIVVGRSLIRSAQLNSVISDVAKYTQAINDFRDKYHALPGDFKGAEAIWGSDSNCPNTTYTAMPHTATCDGNGDGHIGDASGNTPAEWFRAWQQLANAGVIEGGYNGIAGTGSNVNAVPGVNVPASKISGAGYTVYYSFLPNGSATNWPTVGHVIMFGTVYPDAFTYGNAVTPAETRMIDSKIDDGLPAYGRVTVGKSPAHPNCTTSDTASLSTYNTSYQGNACSVIFNLNL
ncbi:MAG: prepilin-type N-terminal cleavage/methylation domain-containing protein [Pseudomonadota bacterium]|nr:prepilin-type N-terminal cleavage/methylation domain-containing protein [Pseudomonadota bacterium]MDE3038223.1 prepilin-type N-terminal cleavage/methylation domain-containing protein [Pseudomonadota bacterium]